MCQMGLPVLQPGAHAISLSAVEALVTTTLLQEKKKSYWYKELETQSLKLILKYCSEGAEALEQTPQKLWMYPGKGF